MEYICVLVILQVYQALASIRSGVIINKLAKIQPVGAQAANRFVPLTELPPPNVPHISSGRRHLEVDCSKTPTGKPVFRGPKVDIAGDYYDDRVGKTVATIIFPDHIDHKHFEVTTQEPYLTLGPIEAIGYHPSTIKSEHPSECEKIYQDHLDEQYSEDSNDDSEESLEMARMPLFAGVTDTADFAFEKLYGDYRK